MASRKPPLWCVILAALFSGLLVAGRKIHIDCSSSPKTLLLALGRPQRTNYTIVFSPGTRLLPGFFNVNRTTGVLTLTRRLHRRIIYRKMFVVFVRSTSVRNRGFHYWTPILVFLDNRQCANNIERGRSSSLDDVARRKHLALAMANLNEKNKPLLERDVRRDISKTRTGFSQQLYEVVSKVKSVDRHSKVLFGFGGVNDPISSGRTTFLRSLENKIRLLDRSKPRTKRNTWNSQPKFTKQRERVSVREDVIVGTEVIVVSASDPNRRLRGKLSYDMKPMGNINSKDFFKINASSGQIKTTKALDREAMDKHQFRVTATDGGSSHLPASMTLIIEVLDVNDHSPVFDQKEYRKNISESSYWGETVLAVRAYDLDAGKNKEIHYSIVNNIGVNQVFIVGERSGVLKVDDDLDREHVPSYRLIVKAEDQGSPQRSSTAEVFITLLDENDCVPVFNQSVYDFSIPENSLRGTFVGATNATDCDIGLNQKIRYSITFGNDDQAFQIMTNSGIIRVKGLLDYEKNFFYSLKVTAEDSGTEPEDSDVLVQISVTDVNDCPPEFLRRDYKFSVKESEDVGYHVGTVQAQDSDSGVNSHVEYFLKNKNSPFQIELKNGRIKTSGKLDREKIGSYHLQVIAQDKGTPPLKNAVNVVITIEDVNDSPPHFTFPKYNTTIAESIPPRKPFLTILAQDDDVGGTIRYSVKSEPYGCFTIDPYRGSLMRSTSCRLDYNKKNEYRFKVEASDGRQKSSVDVVVRISDSNDNSPVFLKSTYAVHIYENQPIGTTVLQVNATDDDFGENARLSYRILGVNKFFKIDPKTGMITTLAHFDREATPKYRFRVIATDNGKPRRSGRARVKVTIKDVNDNSPKFDRDLYKVSLPEDVRVGYLVYSVKATDDDEGKNKQITYSLDKNGNKGGMFKINQDLGDVTVNKLLDRETTSEYTLTVVATDRGKPPQNGTTKIKVSLEDVIDSPPVFQKSRYVVNVSEDYPLKKEVVCVKAVTRDTVKDTQIQYFFQSDNFEGVFTMIFRTGSIELVKPLDYEKKTQYLLIVQAMYGSYLATAEVLINVKDINDMKPVMAEKFEIIINMQKGSFPHAEQFKIPAYDPDASSQLTYKITLPANRYKNALTVDRNTGILRIKESVLTNTHGVEFDVQVSDGLHYVDSHGSIHLNVITESVLNASVTVYLKNATTSKFFASFKKFKKSVGSVLGVEEGNIIVFYVANKTRSRWEYDKEVDDDVLITEDYVTVWMAVLQQAASQNMFLNGKLVLDKLHLNVKKLELEVGMTFLPSDDEIIQGKESNHYLSVNEACGKQDTFKTCFMNKFFQKIPAGVLNTPSVLFQGLKVKEVMKPVCPSGFYGSVCHKKIDFCYSSPCKNGGVCFDLEGGYSCRCQPRFAGKNCNINMGKSRCSQLADDVCLNNGVCKNTASRGFTCKCPSTDHNPDQLCHASTRSFQNGSFIAFSASGLTQHWHIELSLEFATTASSGLLFYVGRYEHDNDFMALEIRDGRLFYTFSAGGTSETVSVAAEKGKSIVQGKWNKVTVSYQNQTGALVLGYNCDSAVAVRFGMQVGNFSCAAAKKLTGNLRSMDLTSPLLLGGLFFTPDRLPIQGKSFNGCIRNVLVNQEPLDMGSPIVEKNTQVGCSSMADFCSSNPCLNQGACVNSWKRAVCQCPDEFSGKRCEIKTTSLDFTSQSFVSSTPQGNKVKLPWSMSTMFRTVEKTGRLMEVTFSSFVSFLQLKDGKLHYRYHTLDLNPPVISLDDGRWHHVEVTWTVTSVRVTVDHVYSAEVKYGGGTLSGRSVNQVALGDTQKSGNGFSGCIKGVVIGGVPLNMNSATKHLVSDGCSSKTKCQSNTCPKERICKEQWRKTSCVCRKGYVGEKCVDICSLQPCQNGATCKRTGDSTGFKCICPDKFLGRYCEIENQRPCRDEFFSASGGFCGPCNCKRALGYNPVCNKTTGYCHCQKNHYREMLGPGRLGKICVRCDCDAYGSVSNACEPIGGQCPCLPGVIGPRCDMCKEKQGEITQTRKGCKIINTSCPRAKAEDITWARVNFGVVAKQKCRFGAQGMAERLCAVGRGWQTPDVTDCATNALVDLEKSMKRYGNLTASTAMKISSKLSNILFAGKNFYQKDIAIGYRITMRLLEFESQQNEENMASSQDEKFLDTVLGAVSTFVDKKYATAWSLIDEIPPATVSLMRQLEEFGVSLASNMVYIKRNQYRGKRSASSLPSFNKIEPNLLMQLEPVNPRTFSGLSFPLKDHEETLLSSREWRNRSNSVHLPASLFRNPGAPKDESAIAFVALKHLGDLLPSSFDVQESVTALSLDVNSDVIVVGIKGMESINLTEPITIEFEIHEVNRSQYDCVFWNYSVPGSSGGGWSKNGCTKAPSNFTHTICKCHHLTSFAVVSDLRIEVPVVSPYSMQIVTYVGISISLVLLLAAILSLTCLSGLNSNTNNIHRNMVLAIVIAEIVYLAGINRTSSKLICRFIAIILHYFFDAVFAWMFVEVIHMYRRLTEKRNIDSGQMTFYYFLGWGCPAIVVGLSTGMAVEGYGNEKFCWMTTDGTLIWTFAIPIVAVMVANTIVFLMAISLSVKKARRKRKHNTYNPKNTLVTSVHKNALKIKYALKVGAAFLPLLAITLVFAVLAANEDFLIFHYLFALLCCCQSVFVILFYVAFDPKVREEFKNAYIRWKTGDKNYGRPKRKRLYEMSYHPGSNLAGEEGYGMRRMNAETTSTDRSTSTLHSTSMSKTDPCSTFPDEDSETDVKEIKEHKRSKRDPVDMESAAKMWNAPEKSEVSTTQPESSDSSDEGRRRRTMVISSESGSSDDESGSWDKKDQTDASKQKGTAPLYASDGPMHSTPLELEQEKARLLKRKPTTETPVAAVEPLPRSKLPSILKNSSPRAGGPPPRTPTLEQRSQHTPQPVIKPVVLPTKTGSEASSGSSLSSPSDDDLVLQARLLSQSTEGGMSTASSKDRKRRSRKTRDMKHGKKSRHHHVHFHRTNPDGSKVRVKVLNIGEGKPLTDEHV